jgi:hypothetical protein
MKRFWTALSVLAIAAAGTWYFRDRLPLDQIPYLKQFSSASPQPGAETAAQSSQNGQPARQSGQRQGGGRRNGAPPTVSTIAVAKATLPMDATATGSPRFRPVSSRKLARRTASISRRAI